MTDKTKKTTPVKSAPKKKDMKILYEAVQENPTRNYIIMGALTRAGLYNQYCKEKRLYGIENLQPTITIEELNKIITNYLGE